jgi:hypothetical protein
VTSRLRRARGGRIHGVARRRGRRQLGWPASGSRCPRLQPRRYPQPSVPAGAAAIGRSRSSTPGSLRINHPQDPIGSPEVQSYRPVAPGSPDARPASIQAERGGRGGERLWYATGAAPDRAGLAFAAPSAARPPTRVSTASPPRWAATSCWSPRCAT